MATFLPTVCQAEAALDGAPAHGALQHLVKAEVTQTGMPARQDHFVDGTHQADHTGGCGVITVWRFSVDLTSTLTSLRSVLY